MIHFSHRNIDVVSSEGGADCGDKDSSAGSEVMSGCIRLKRGPEDVREVWSKMRGTGILR